MNMDVLIFFVDIFVNYNLNIWLGCNGFLFFIFKVLFYFISIKDFDELESKFFISGVFEFFWNDDWLKWNISMYGGDFFSIVILK